MAATCDIREKTIPDLPPEILNHIFTFLPYNLRVVRLVCSKWNQSCNTEKVSGREKIVIGRARAKEFFSSRTLSRNIYNLYLKKMAFKPGHVKFFKKFGVKLRSLKLHACRFDYHEYVPFLPFCKNLSTLTLYATGTIVKTFRCLNGSYIQTNIVSLRIANRHNTWSDEAIDCCFRVCPHLRSLTLDWPSRSDSDMLSFNCIHNAILIRAANIVELNLRWLGILPEQIEQIASIPDLKLQKLNISDNYAVTERNICNIVNLQPDLRNITIRRCYQKRVDEYADCIGRCSKLTRLEIDEFCFRGIALNGKLIDALTSHAYFHEFVLKTSSSSGIYGDFECSRRTFDHLRKLKLALPHIDYIHCFLKKVSVKLKHLTLTRLDKLSSKTLEFISNHFTSLETLKLRIRIHDMRVYALWEEHCSEQISWKFEELKNLQIRFDYARATKKPPTSILARIKAPNLKSLKLSGFDALDATVLLDMAKNYPSLEYFMLSNTKLKVEPLTLRMSEWKKLNFLYHDGIEYLQLHRRRENEEKFDFDVSLLEGSPPSPLLPRRNRDH